MVILRVEQFDGARGRSREAFLGEVHSWSAPAVVRRERALRKKWPSTLVAISGDLEAGRGPQIAYIPSADQGEPLAADGLRSGDLKPKGGAVVCLVVTNDAVNLEIPMI